MIPIILSTSAGDLLDIAAIGIAGNYELLTLLIVVSIFFISYLFGRHVFAILATSLAVIGLSIWGTQMNSILLTLVAILFGSLIIMLIYRVTNK